MRRSTVLFLLLLAARAQAQVAQGPQLRDATGGLLGLAALLFFMRLCFKGDANPPAPGFITDKRLERELRAGAPAAEIEAD